MRFGGIQKLTLVDFPGQVATTIFTLGCNFRCGYCHNPELVLPQQQQAFLSEDEVFNFLESRIGKISGVCISGGEPLLQPDISKFIVRLKALGFNVKLDTNGSYPEKLEEIIKEGEVDYIAMDIKGPLSKYALISGNKSVEQEISKSIKLIIGSDIDYEFRTTLCHPYLKVSDFDEIANLISGAKRYFLQNFEKSKQIDQEINFSPFSSDEIEEIKRILDGKIGVVTLR